MWLAKGSCVLVLSAMLLKKLLRLMTIACLAAVAVNAAALVPTVTNIGSQVGTVGSGELASINSNVFAQDLSQAGLPTPTGSIYFTVNGILASNAFTVTPAATDPTVANGQGIVSFAAPGTYQLISHYSGDSFYAPSTSTYFFTLDVVNNPPRFALQLGTNTLSFASGATTGNTDPLTLVAQNGFRGTEQVSCTISELPNETPAYFPATCNLVPGIAPDGSAIFIVTIGTTAPVTVSGKLSHGLGSEAPWALLLCFTVPLFLRSRRRYRALALSVAMVCTLGCGGAGVRSASSSPPAPEQVRSSAGHYPVQLSGIGSDQATGDITAAQPISLSVTVE